jgi:murein DD-endopeptidase MepM/ murein hydrolase activator NlpD
MEQTLIRLGMPLPGKRIVAKGRRRRKDDVLPNGRECFRCVQRFEDVNKDQSPLPHGALDLGNHDCGDLVLAAEAGRATTDEQDAGGLGVKIDHGGKLVTEYWHLSEILVEDGTDVIRGQEIGKVGETGSSTSDCHLHYVVKLNGVLQDPWPTLPQNHSGGDMFEWVATMKSTKETTLVMSKGTLRKSPSHHAEPHAVVGVQTETPLTLEVVGKVELPDNKGLWFAVRRKGGDGLFLAANSDVVKIS